MSAALHTEASTRIPEDAVHIRSDMDTVRLCIGIASAFVQVSRIFFTCFVRAFDAYPANLKMSM